MGKYGAATVPRPDTQAVLDTALERADPAARMRSQMLLAEASDARHPLARTLMPRPPDYETWADDLERAVVYLSRQNFDAATGLLNRWLTRYPTDQRGTDDTPMQRVRLNTRICAHLVVRPCHQRTGHCPARTNRPARTKLRAEPSTAQHRRHPPRVRTLRRDHRPMMIEREPS
ncbi:MAG: hypothetical protein J2P17_30470 [Mycobacterium sp.]|nr:hypothetical protein [Mycobacterium sp.]